MDRYGFYQQQGDGLLFLILLFLFLGAIAWLIISAIQNRHPHAHNQWWDRSHPHAPSGAPGRDDDPLRILDRRFASGEIDEDEYQRRRKVLSGNP
jgi:putative membrane protein